MKIHTIARLGFVALLAAGCIRPQEQTAPPQAASVDAPPPGEPRVVLESPPAAGLDQSRALMWRLARQVRLLGLLTDQPDEAASDARTQLQEMEEIALAIAALPERRGHPLLDRNIGGLIGDIRRARAEVAGASPEWGTTHSITTACVRCHELRTCPFDSYQQCVDLPIY